ncbi:MAG: GumC family protein [Marinibacterium sp.]
METLRYYLSIFRRRILYFLIVSTIISASAVIIATTLPPAYVSRMVLLVESPQIPQNLAASTVTTSAFEQLQIVQQQLMTRENLLSIARKHQVLPEIDKMSPDDIVSAMQARTNFNIGNPKRGNPPTMVVTFEAAKARTSAAVLNEYLTMIQQKDTEFRQGRAGETLEFFEQEVDRLSQALDAQSARILEYEQANTDASPTSLQFRMNQQASYQNQLIQIDQNIANLKAQRAQLIQLYEATGSVTGKTTKPQKTPDEIQRDALKSQLQNALVIYAADNPRVTLLEARIAQLEEKIAADAATRTAADPSGSTTPLPAVLTIQLSDLDNQIAALEAQKPKIQDQLDKLTASIERTPEVTIVLNEMNRKYASIKALYDQTENRLAVARTGDRIETRSRGQRITVVEQPVVPSAPTKPNRKMIAGGGMAFGILAGIALVVLLELLNSSARRPEDIVGKLGVTPLTTIPYIQTTGQRIRQRAFSLLGVLLILVGIPAAIYLVHTFYLPLDLLAERVMNKLGVRW